MMKLPPIRDALPDWRSIREAALPRWRSFKKAALPRLRTIKEAIAEHNFLSELSKQQLVLGGGAIILVGLGGLGAYTFLQGGDNETKETAATSSEQMPTVVSVKKADLRDDFTVQAKMAAESNRSYTLPAPEGERTVVTSAMKQPGDVLHSGMPVLEINDRPILAFVGDIPMYRTLVRGVRGGDVERLQESLASLGYNVSVDGRFGKQTEVALKKHFKSIGSTVPLCPITEPLSEQPKKSDQAKSGKETSKGSVKGNSGNSKKMLSALNPFELFRAITPIFANGDADPSTNEKIRQEQEQRAQQDAQEDRAAIEEAERKQGNVAPGSGGAGGPGVGGVAGGSAAGGASAAGGGVAGDGKAKPGIGDGKSDKAQEGETVGPCLRVSDAIFVPVANAKVVSAPKTGEILSGETKLVVTDGSSGLVATIPEKETGGIKPGVEAVAMYKGSNVAITVVSVTEVKTTPDGKPLPEDNKTKNFTVTFAPKEQGVFNDLGDQQVLLSVPRTKPILGQLVVPQRAISQDSTGTTSVLVKQGNQYQAVRVESLGCVAGQCAVKPINGQLKEGDMIRVDQT